MSAADLSMIARESKFGWINAAIGEPYFLQEALRFFYPLFGEFKTDAFKYPASEGMAALREAIVAEPGHHLSGFDPRNVVITAGAKQGLLAALHSFKHEQFDTATMPAPYWPSLPGLINRAGMSFVPYPTSRSQYVQLLTVPNNPTGNHIPEVESRLKWSNQPLIWDAVYAAPLYGSYSPLNADAIVGSASKIYGLSGLRVGWAAFRNPDLAAAASLYAETTTSGVSTLAQQYMLQFLRRVDAERGWFESLRGIAANTLVKNAGMFNQYIRPFTQEVRGVPAGDGGMFAWFSPAYAEPFKKALEVARINLVDGVYAGQQGYYRMNMGLTADVFATAAIALNTALERK